MLHSPSTQSLPEEQSPAADETEPNGKYCYLIVNDRWHEISVGETKVGRDASICTIVLDNDTVSKEHAIVESEGAEDTFIYDVGSKNKTKIGKMTLKPHCRYKISDNDVIKLGNSSIKFKVTDYLVKNNKSTLPQELCTPDKNAILSDQEYKQIRKINSPVADEMPVIMNKNCEKEASQTFKSPSTFFKGNLKQVKKYYYIPAGESSSVVDIFSQATQCELKDTKEDGNCQSDNSQSKCVNDDDIYNLSTQCTYAGDFLKPLDKINSEISLLKNSSLIKSKETIHFVLNDSGTFGFVNENKNKNHTTSFMRESLTNDIFELATQCDAKLTDSVSANKLDFKDIINKPDSFAESVKTKCKVDPNSHEKKISVENDCVEAAVSNFISVGDGEDEELMKLIGTNSPVTSTSNHSPIVFKNNIIKTELIKPNDILEEMFAAVTQVSSDLTNKNDFNKCVEKSPMSDTIDEHKSSYRSEKTLDIIKYHQSERQEKENVVAAAENLKKVCCRKTSMNAPVNDEDMILTQVFNPSQQIRKKNSSVFLSTNAKETRSNQKEIGDFVAQTYEGYDKSEDLKATQLFVQCDRPDHRKNQIKRAAINSSQDDIITQVFQFKVREQNHINNSSKANEEDEVLSVIPTECPPKPVPDLVLLSDSGDETESDLEIKICLESSIKKEKFYNPSDKTDPGDSSSKRQVDSDSSGRPTSASSDKTVSDLDVAELAEASSAVLKVNHCEDFISTQIFSSIGDLSKSNEKFILNTRETFNKSENDYEDFISTQAFTIAATLKSPSDLPDKTKSDFANTLLPDPRPATGYAPSHSCSEDAYVIEDNSNESESLIKEIEEFGPPSPIIAARKRRSLTPLQAEKPESDSSLTLPPSHPAFAVFSEIDELIGNNVKGNDKSDSGIGGDNFFERDVESGRKLPQAGVESDSDVTDCEEELTANKNLRRQETFVISKSGLLDSKSSVMALPYENVLQSSSIPTAQKSHETFLTSVGNGKRPSENTNSEDSVKFDRVSDSPLKRIRLTNSDEGVQKKKAKGVETRRKKKIDIQADDIVLTQSLKLRNRVVRRRKTTPDCASSRKKTVTERKTPGREKLTTDSGNQIESALRVKTPEEHNSARRRLAEDFTNVPDEKTEKMKGLRRKKSNGNDAREGITVVTKVVFTGFESECHDRIIQKLGGEKVNHLDGVHVLVTDRARRTVKFLSAVALGLPIVSPKWLTASAKETKFLNPWDYLLEDKPSEERWGFNLKLSLEMWRRQKLLHGYTIFATESARPPIDEILSIAKCCGGLPGTSRPEIWPEKSIVLTCVEDKKWWPPSKWKQVKIVHYEFLLSGVLRHFMDFKSYKLR